MCSGVTLPRLGRDLLCDRLCEDEVMIPGTVSLLAIIV